MGQECPCNQGYKEQFEKMVIHCMMMKVVMMNGLQDFRGIELATKE